MIPRVSLQVVIFVIVGVAIIFLFLLRGPSIAFKRADLPAVAPAVVDPNADLPNQSKLSNPPEVVKALYATNWSAASEKKIEYFLDLLNTTELNAIVVDIKDYTGIVGYDIQVPAVREYKAYEKRIPKINALIKRFHDAGVYVIGRIAVFQDIALVKARPDLAIKSAKTGGVWGDRKNVHWLDTAATPVWDYNIDIARDALARGFDEINFDYIRFATDGDIDDIVYPYYRSEIGKRAVLRNFFNHLRTQLPYERISADIFGEAVVNYSETTIGQYLEDTLAYFDHVAPMIYPSHYNKNFIGLANAAASPYEVIRYSMDRALERATDWQFSGRPATSTEEWLPPFTAEMRPWLQDFDLGAKYTADLVRAQIEAVDDSARAAAGCPGVIRSTKKSQQVSRPMGERPVCNYRKIGWMLWSPSTVYTKGALRPE